jgi:protein-tyrosine-phosphatase
MHWSVPDPVETNRIDGFREAFDEVARRVDRLIDAIPMEVT